MSLAGRWPPADDSYGEEAPSGADSASEGGSPAWARAPLATPLSGGSPGTSARGRGSEPKADGDGEKTRRQRSSGTLAVYSPVVHCGSIRQAAYVLAMSELVEGASALGALQSDRFAGCWSAKPHAIGRAIAYITSETFYWFGSHVYHS